MFHWTTHHSARIVVRKKLLGGGDHYGVQLSDGSILHLTPEGVQWTTAAGFAQGLPVKPVYTSPTPDYHAIMGRVEEAMTKPQSYALLNWNCEHFANWLVGRPAESSQINGLVAAGVVLAFVGAFASQ